MGMAASQARYLALVARKSNCEYEGQQINQARTVLSNQSANLFNQMLGLNVPVPPSTQDYTYTQYSFNDGAQSSTIESWKQLSSADPDYNYVVTYYYYTDKYTGSMKKLSDPQVQFSTGGTEASGAQIKAALDRMTETYAEYEKAVQAREGKEAEAANLKNYADRTKYTNITGYEYDNAEDKYTINYAEGSTADFVGYNKLAPEVQATVKEAIERLVNEGALKKDINNLNMDDVYYNSSTNDIVFLSDLNSLYNGTSAGTSTILPAYNTESIKTKADGYDAEIQSLKQDEADKLNEYNLAVAAYESLNRPTYIGNCELTPLATLSDDDRVEINQIIADMKEQNINSSLASCFDAQGNYTGGIYSFQLNGVTYYTTFNDLSESYNSGTGNNHIDGQTKLTYYNASYVSTKVEKTQKALLETDGNGRFTSVRFEDDTVTYTLNVETVTDDAAYQDAMNQYYYDNAVYDKMVRDINAKTSIIQQEDLQLELRLKQLDTEQQALSTEIDAVSKVVSDNIEDSFKTFGG